MPDLPFSLILASGSPRRKDMLTEAGYDFTVIPPQVEELEDPSILIAELTQINAKLKAEAVANSHPEAIVIAADTLVLRDDVALGKPKDQAEAKSMSQSLNNRCHQVFTAVYVIRKTTESIREFTVVTDVCFKNLSDSELEKYHSLIDPMDKAGAYAAQDHGDLIIESIQGSMTNVIGLPMDELREALEEIVDDATNSNRNEPARQTDDR